MLVAAAVCPQTPLLVPEVASGAADELADVRKACLTAVTRVGTCKPDLLVVIAPGAGSGARVGRLEGTFRRFGVDLVVGAATDGEDAAVEPCCGLLVGRWLLDAAASSADFACEAWEIGEDTEPEECARLGRELAGRSERVAFLVMADGSARRTLKAPGYLDDRAEPFDDEIARALATVDTKSLAAIDPTAASDLMAAGRAPWQVLAGAAETGESDPGERQWHGELLSCCAPYGVGYFAALWMSGRPAAVGA
ncbi:MAG TPA: class III extradiol dioxygenase subunit B-like domain-containing protein [Actinocrinis sp.]|nr:class III extradiol dioxygenase subunit B-like domain-containing protein [Actinocrinis sp.]